MTSENRRPAAQRGVALLESLHVSSTSVRFEPAATIFAQGDPCAGVMYIARGRVQLSATSPQGRTAMFSVLRAGALFGEGALAGQRRRKSTARAMTACTISMVKTSEIRRRLQHEVALSDWLRSQILLRNAHIEEDLVTQIFNRTEKRLARALLLLAGFDEHQQPRHSLPTISRKLLAEMCSTTPAVVDRLMNSFRKRGFIERQTAKNGGTQIHRSMMDVLLHG
jgi:CRP/FNR family transcriptional regulator, cyclic AMP receptor protein